MRAASGVVFLVVLAACRSPEPVTSPNTVEVAETDAGTSPPAPPRAKPTKSERIIEEGAVGDIVVGKPIPEKYLKDAPRYEARWVADAQPMDGFLIGEPPMWVTIHGPLHDAEPGPLEPLIEKLGPKALEMARGGTPVDGIVIEVPGIQTAAGIGVGSTHAELESAYGKIRLLRNPEWFDSNITCDATVAPLAKVRFLLASCKEGTEYGPVKRILVGG